MKNFMELPISALKKAEWNYKTNNPDILEKLKANLAKNAQIENILVRELGDSTYEVVNGNHRLDAFQDLGYDTIVAYNLGSISEAHAKRIAIETNETHFENDHLKLSEIISQLVKETFAEELAKTMPFSVADIESMANLSAFDWDKANQTILQDDTQAPKITFQITVGEDDVIIEQELQDICGKYPSAEYKRI